MRPWPSCWELLVTFWVWECLVCGGMQRVYHGGVGLNTAAPVLPPVSSSVPPSSLWLRCLPDRTLRCSACLPPSPAPYHNSSVSPRISPSETTTFKPRFEGRIGDFPVKKEGRASLGVCSRKVLWRVHRSGSLEEHGPWKGADVTVQAGGAPGDGQGKAPANGWRPGAPGKGSLWESSKGRANPTLKAMQAARTWSWARGLQLPLWTPEWRVGIFRHRKES